MRIAVVGDIMTHSDFTIGEEFSCGQKRWRCTDIGKRVVVAICVSDRDDSSWFRGPPYAICETVFDEYDLKGCHPLHEGTVQ